MLLSLLAEDTVNVAEPSRVQGISNKKTKILTGTIESRPKALIAIYTVPRIEFGYQTPDDQLRLAVDTEVSVDLLYEFVDRVPVQAEIETNLFLVVTDNETFQGDLTVARAMCQCCHTAQQGA